MSLYDSILITGGNGMLGRALGKSLRDAGRRATSLSRAELDIADTAALAGKFAFHKPTLVLNCAAHTKVDLCETEPDQAAAINGYAVGQMARLCREFGACLVHVSTDFVFDGALRRPFRPDDAVNPMSAYGRSKLLGEAELRQNAPKDWLIVRTAWVYGLHGANFPRTMVTAARAGKPLKVVADQFGCPTYAADLAEGILALLDKGARGIWHVTNSGQTNWHEFAKAALEEFGLKAEVAPLTSEQWNQIRPNCAPRPLYSVLDISAFEQKVGRPMRPWREGLRDYREAVERNGGF
jgi:dTDP-4-dehydrorhamnose reductase